jgi:putative flippase GtrA
VTIPSARIVQGRFGALRVDVAGHEARFRYETVDGRVRNRFRLTCACSRRMGRGDQRSTDPIVARDRTAFCVLRVIVIRTESRITIASSVPEVLESEKAWAAAVPRLARARELGAFVRFAAVGALGYAANLVVFAALVGAGLHYLPAALVAWTAAALQNYALNRAWTFREARGPVLGQGARFLLVSAAALCANLLVLEGLTSLDLPKLVAQALAVAAALPLNFGGNRLWTFRAAAPVAVEVGGPGAASRLDAAAAALRLRLSAALTPERVAAYRALTAWWAVSRLVVFAAATVVQVLRWPRRSWYPSLLHHPFALLSAWDGRWYRMVAERGYLPVPSHQSDTAFFPLFPLLTDALRALGLPLDAAGILIANASLLFGLAALYELTRLWLDEQSARRAAIYAAIFPVGYVFSMAYPEALVLSAMALAGVLAARGRWRAAAIAAAAAALARPEAILLVLPLGALGVQAWREAASRERGRIVGAVAAAPAALGGIALYDWRTFGDPLAFSSAQRAWNRRLSIHGLDRAVLEVTRSPGTYNVWLFRDAAFCVVYLLCLCLALRAGVPRSWTLAGALIVLLPLWSGSFTSDARFGLLALPVYPGLAFLGRRPWLDRTIRLASLPLLGAGAATILLRWP